MATRTRIRASLPLAQRVLSHDLVELLGGDEGSGAGGRRFAIPLTVDLGGGTTLRQVVEVFAGRARPGGDGVLRMPLSWEVTGRHLFPTFDGMLEVQEDGGGCTLVLTGHCDVPSGLLGRLGDATAGRRVAQRSLEDVLAELGQRLDDIVERRQPVGFRHHVIDLRDQPQPAAPDPEETPSEDVPCSEIYIG